jgi:hypothetical protein
VGQLLLGSMALLATARLVETVPGIDAAFYAASQVTDEILKPEHGALGKAQRVAVVPAEAHPAEVISNG